MSTIHPLIQDGLNPEQLAAVLQDTNCVIAAGAGSGKTFVLARRFAHLVIDCGMSVDSILTLTFTKKASSEMYQRIYKTLKEIAISPQSEGLAKERSQRAIADFHTAHIQTIDSFCASIVRSASRFYGIRPDFIIDDKAVKEFAQTTARDFMLKHRNNAALQELTALGRLEDSADAVFANPILAHSNIAKPLNFSEAIAKQITHILDEWQHHIDHIFSNRKLFEESYADCTEIFQSLEDFFPTKEDLSHYFSVQQNTEQDAKNQHICYDEIRAKIVNFFDALYTVKKKRKNKPIGFALDEMRNAYDSLTGIAQYMLNFPSMLKIIPLLEDFQKVCNEWKRSSGNLTFADVSSLALLSLLEHPSIRKSEKYGISAIMIDEFQDNNEMQRDLLFLLAENPDRMETSLPSIDELCPDKLFFVGDEKQSVYLFRGADVSVFKKLATDLACEGKPNDLSLSINYRSDSQLLAAFNSLFGGYAYSGAKSAFREAFEAGLCPIENGKSVFIQKHQLIEGQTLQAFEAEYRPLYAPPINEITNDADDDTRIHFCLLDNTKTDGENDSSPAEDENTAGNEENLVEAENLAIFTAEKIAALCAIGQNSKTAARYKPEDIALLFRSYTKQSLYEKHLRRCGIPYVSESITGFFGDAPVNDIFSLIRLIVYPQDAASYAIVLRSPFVRLTHQETASCLLSLSTDKKADNGAESEVLLCEQGGVFLTKTEKNRYLNGLERYNRLRLAATTANCAEMISLLWYNEGYRYETMWDMDASLFAELYDYLFELARMIDEEGGNLSHLADYLSELAATDERLNDMDIPLDRPEAVRLMSIHKSKGLEFPLVFLCGASSRGRANTLSDKIYVNTEWGASLNFPRSIDIQDCQVNYFYKLMSSLASQKAEAELRRLLYVALTRAKTELYITASFSLNKVAKEKFESELEYMANVGEVCTEEEKLYVAMSALFDEKVSGAKMKISEKTLVNPDYCTQSNSLFGFLLPQIVQFREKIAPFSLENIPSMNRGELQKISHGTKKLSMNEVYKKVLPVFENTQVRTTPIIESPYRTPSKLDASHNPATCIQEQNSAFVENRLPALDEIVATFKNGNFDYSHFGTIAHAFVESAFTNKEVYLPPTAISALSPKQLKTICDLAHEMAEQFVQSPLGQKAKAAKWRKNEYDFKLLLKPPAHSEKNAPEKIIVNGQIDLLYEDANGTLHIVDYKTDAIENPDTHILQLAAYRRAAAHMRNKRFEDVQCYLYYLRTGTAVNVTAQTAKVDLEGAAFGKSE